MKNLVLILLILTHTISILGKVEIDNPLRKFYSKINNQNDWNDELEKRYNELADSLGSENFHISIFDLKKYYLTKQYNLIYAKIDDINTINNNDLNFRDMAYLYEFGLFHSRIGYRKKAISYFEQANDLLSDSLYLLLKDDPIYYGLKKSNTFELSILYREAGDFDKSRKLMRNYLDNVDDDNLSDQAVAIREYANSLFGEGKNVQAYNFLNNIDIDKFSDYPYLQFGLFSVLSYANFKIGDLEKAIELEKRSLELRKQKGSLQLVINSNATLVKFYTVNGQLDSAKKYYDILENLFPIESNYNISYLLDVLSVYYDSTGNNIGSSITKTILKNELDESKVFDNIYLVSDYLEEQIHEKEVINREKAFYKTSVFIIVLLLIVLLLIVLLLIGVYYYAYSRKLRYQEKLLFEQIDKNLIANKRLDNELKLRKKIIGVLSHDLISPMNSSEKLLDIAMQFDINNEELLEIISISKNSINENINLIKSITSWANNAFDEDQYNPEMNSINDIIFEIEKSFATQFDYYNIVFKNLLNKDYSAYFDKNMVRTIFRNLVQNSIKYAGANSTIEISIKNDQNNLNVYISDNGVGLPKEIIDEIRSFKENQTDFPNSSFGFGFKITLEFIKINKGDLFVNNVHKGSEIWFTLPKNMAT